MSENTAGASTDARDSTLYPFRVTLREDPEDKFQIAFDCHAEDNDHAVEQARNAYPRCAIVHSMKLSPAADLLSQITQGDWSINEWIQSDSTIAIGAVGTPLIARVFVRDVSINEQKANARLIKAAPTFLEALVEIAKNDPYRQSSAGNIARDALAKAGLVYVATSTAAEEQAEQDDDSTPPPKYHLVSMSSEIFEDHFGKGEGDFTGCGYTNEHIGQTFETRTGMFNYLHRVYGFSKDPSDYEVGETSLFTEIQRANHSEAQNGGWFAPTPAEIAAWKEGKLKLYTEKVVIKFHRVN